MNDYWVCFPPGASGNFLAHFLHPKFLDTVSGLRVDGHNSPFDLVTPEGFEKMVPNDCGDEHNDPIFKYTGQRKIDKVSHNMTDEPIKFTKTKKVIRILTSSISEKFRAIFNMYFKHDEYYDLKLKTFEYLMNKHYDQVCRRYIQESNGILMQYDTGPKTWAINLQYNDIFNLYKLVNLYYKINEVVCPEYKIQYAQSYIEKNVNLYNSWQFQAMERIFTYEYTNNLFETQNKIRLWSMDDIIEENWKNFLDEHLCLTNYH